jgi:hypothetical protein
MSSRKRKKAINGENSAADGGELELVAPEEPTTPEAEPTEAAPPPEVAAPAEEEDARTEIPAISSINELRPREGDDESVSEEHELAANETGDSPIDSLPPAAAPATRAHLKRVIESLIFVSDQVISPQQLARIV